VGMTIVTFTVFKKTYARAMKQYAVENKAKSLEDGAKAVDLSVHKNGDKDNKSQAGIFPMHKIKEIIYLIVTLMIFTLLKGSLTLPSIVGVEYCSANYWLIHVGSIAVCFYFLKRNLAIINASEKAQNDPKTALDNNYTDIKREKIPGLLKISCFAGILSGMLIGGGILLNSYFLEMGLTPQSVGATMTLFLMIPFFMLMFTSVMSGRVEMDEFFWYMGLSMIGAFIISTYLTHLAKKHKRQSILLCSLCLVLGMVLIVVPAYGIQKIVANPDAVLSFHSIC